MDLSIILVNWNALELTATALTSLQEHVSGITYETFVVDNGSTRDRSAQEIPERFPWVRFVASGTNLGFSGANNLALRQAAGRYRLLLNSDTIQTGNAIGEAVHYLDAHPQVGVLGILHRNHDAGCTPQPSTFAFPNPVADTFALLLSRGSGASTPEPAADHEQDVDWACGSFLMIRRECLEQVGLLDERFFVYDEDIDWCRRARRLGWPTRFWPGASMIHLGAASNAITRDKTLVMFRGRLTYIRKHHSLASAVFYYLVLSLRLTLATLKQTGALLAGRASGAAVRERWRRQVQFMLLRPSRCGV